MKDRNRFTTFFPLLALAAWGAGAGCTVGPDYHAPTAQTAPAQWAEPVGSGTAAGPASLAAWWKNFNDAELDSLITRALHENLDLRIAEARVRQSRAQLGSAKSSLGPSFDTKDSFARERQSANQPIFASLLPPSVPLEDNVYQAGFDASWELDVFGGGRRSIEAAHASLDAALFNQADMQVTLVSEIAQNYLAARMMQSRLGIARRNIAAEAKEVTLARERYQHGLTNSLDAEQASTVLAQTEASVPVLETQLQMSIHRLGVLLGQSPEALLGELGVEAPPLQAPPNVPVGLPSDLLLRRPDIREAERKLAAATAQIGVATADLFPKFSLTGDIGFESVSPSTWFDAPSRFWSVGPTAQWQLFDSGRVRANIRLQSAKQEEALASYEKTVSTGFEDVENALVSYAKEQVRNQALRRVVTSSGNSLRIAQEQYTRGLSSFINVLDAERSTYQAQDTLAQSDQDVIKDVIALYKALGGGWQTT